MKGNEKKKKELKKVKSDGTSTKVQSDYQQDKARKSTIEPSPFKPKKHLSVCVLRHLPQLPIN